MCVRLIAENRCFLPASCPGRAEEIFYSLNVGAMPCLHLHPPLDPAFRRSVRDTSFTRGSPSRSPTVDPPSILHVHLDPNSRFLRPATIQNDLCRSLIHSRPIEPLALASFSTLPIPPGSEMTTEHHEHGFRNQNLHLCGTTTCSRTGLSD